MGTVVQVVKQQRDAGQGVADLMGDPGRKLAQGGQTVEAHHLLAQLLLLGLVAHGDGQAPFGILADGEEADFEVRHAVGAFDLQGLTAVPAAAGKYPFGAFRHVVPSLEDVAVMRIDADLVAEEMPAGGIDRGQQSIGREGDDGAGDTLQDAFLEVPFIEDLQPGMPQFVQGGQQACLALFQFIGHTVEGAGKLSHFVGRRDRHASAGGSFGQQAGAVGQLLERPADAPREPPGRQPCQDCGGEHDDTAAGPVLPELAADQPAPLACRIVELVDLEADGHAAEDAVFAVIAGIVEDRGIGHDLLGPSYVGDVHRTD